MKNVWIVGFLDDSGRLERTVAAFSSFKRACEWANSIEALPGSTAVTNIYRAVLNDPGEGVTDIDLEIAMMEGHGSVDHAED